MSYGLTALTIVREKKRAGMYFIEDLGKRNPKTDFGAARADKSVLRVPC